VQKIKEEQALGKSHRERKIRIQKARASGDQTTKN
jgi:hypothetical protein